MTLKAVSRECCEPLGIGHDVQLAVEAANRVHLDDARHRSQLGLHHPIVQHAQIDGRVVAALGLLGAGLGLDGVEEDLAEAGSDGPHGEFDTLRQLIFHLLQALVDECARPIDIGAVLEYYGDLRQPIARQ